MTEKLANATSQNSNMLDRPWLFRTYSGHSSAAESNALYRKNLARGQTGLSVAFDLPTQTGYDSDHPLARGEVGKVGVPIGHLGDMQQLFDGIRCRDSAESGDTSARKDGRRARAAPDHLRRRAAFGEPGSAISTAS